VSGCSDENGRTTLIGGAQLMATGQLILRGDIQTAPLAGGQAGPLRLRAVFNGQECGSSTAFSVCSHPSAVYNGPECLPHVGYEDGTMRVGMYIEIRIKSDSGVDGDLNQVTDQEQVSEGRDHSPLLNGYPAGGETADPEPAHTARFDRHRNLLGDIRSIDHDRLHGQPGSWSNDQLDLNQAWSEA